MDWASGLLVNLRGLSFLLLCVNAYCFALLCVYLHRAPAALPPAAAAAAAAGAAAAAPVPAGPRSVLLVTAHPDDEAMFFMPVLRALRATHVVHVLCLSTGDADGLGQTRRRELVQCCALLGVPEARVHVVDHPQLRDGMTTAWDPAVVAALVGAAVQAHGIQRILTFDEGGVSGHPNHVAVHAGVRLLFSSGALPGPAGVGALTLDTVPLLRKYAGPLDLLASAFSPWLFTAPDGPLASYAAMSAHRSQFVWYRRLFVIFSRRVAAAGRQAGRQAGGRVPGR